MDIYSATKAFHFGIGVAALATFWIAGLTRKGSPIHKMAGKVYLITMIGILLSATLMGIIGMVKQPGPAVAFLFYLIVITATACWRSWRAIRDKREFQRYIGPVYRVLEIANPLAGMTMMAIGISIESTLFAGFSVIGMLIGIKMYRLRRNGPAHALWWRSEHISAMLGNGIATHVAFLVIGLPKLLPALAGPTLELFAWFGPLTIATALGFWLNRKYAPGGARPGMANKSARWVAAGPAPTEPH